MFSKLISALAVFLFAAVGTILIPSLSHAKAGGADGGGGKAVIDGARFKFLDLLRTIDDAPKSPRVRKISRSRRMRELTLQALDVTSTPGFKILQALASENPLLTNVMEFALKSTGWISTNTELKDLKDQFVKPEDRSKHLDFIQVAIHRDNVVLLQGLIFAILGEQPLYQGGVLVHETIRSIAQFAGLDVESQFVQGMTEALICNSLTAEQKSWLKLSMGGFRTDPAEFAAKLEVVSQIGVAQKIDGGGYENARKRFSSGELSALETAEFLSATSQSIDRAISDISGNCIHAKSGEFIHCLQENWLKQHPMISYADAQALSTELNHASSVFWLRAGAELSGDKSLADQVRGLTAGVPDLNSLQGSFIAVVNALSTAVGNASTADEVDSLVSVMKEVTHYATLSGSRLFSNATNRMYGTSSLYLAKATLEASGYKVLVAVPKVTR